MTQMSHFQQIYIDTSHTYLHDYCEIIIVVYTLNRKKSNFSLLLRYIPPSHETFNPVNNALL